MRAVFSLVGLVLVVAIVGLLVARQLDARRAAVHAAPVPAASATAADSVPREGMSQQDARALQKQIQTDLNQAVKQGEASRREAVDGQ